MDNLMDRCASRLIEMFGKIYDVICVVQTVYDLIEMSM